MSAGDPTAPAHSIEIEQALLGAILVNNRAFDHLDGLRPDHFYEPLHRVIFEGAQALVQAGKPATPLTIRTMLPAEMKVGDISIAMYLARLAAEATTVINANGYAGHLRAFKQIREMQGILEDVAAHERRYTQPDDAVRDAYMRLDALRLDQPGGSSSETAAQGSKSFVSWMSGVMSGAIGEAGIPSGLSDLDRIVGGLRPGELLIMAGRPGMGKTSVGAGISRNVARGGRAGAGIFSLEMHQTQLMARFHCDEAFDDSPNGDVVAYQQALSPRQLLNMRQAERLYDAGLRFSELPLMCDFSSNLTVGEIAAKARGWAHMLDRKFKKPLGLVVVDYLKFVRASDRYRGQRVYEVGEISASLKQLAKDLQVPVILLAQLSRVVEQREDKVPQLSDLRDSGDLEADADVVVFLFREAYYLQNNPKTATDVAMQTRLIECVNKLTLLVAKNRNGPTGSTDVYVHMGASAVRNLHRDDRGEPQMFR